MSMESIRIENMYDLKETIAAEIFEGKTYPWEVLPFIKEFIVKLGNTLDPEDVEKRFLAWITPYNKPEDTSSESTSSKEIVDNSMADDAWAAIEEELIAEGFLDNKKK